MKDLNIQEINDILLNEHFALNSLMDILAYCAKPDVSCEMISAIIQPHLSAIEAASIALANLLDKELLIEKEAV